MAFTVNPDHARRAVWEALQRSVPRAHRPPHAHRSRRPGLRQRAQFVGIEAYEAEGGVILRDLFNSDDGGWLQDPALLDRLMMEKLEREADSVRAEGWRWVEVAPDFPYGHTYNLRRLVGEQRPLTEEETTAHDALRAEFDKLEETYAEANKIPEEVDQRLSEIETALAAFEERPAIYDTAEIARAGAFVSIDGSGAVRIERGYVRPDDEPPIVPSQEDASDHDHEEPDAGTASAPDHDPAAAADAASARTKAPSLSGRVLQRMTTVFDAAGEGSAKACWVLIRRARADKFESASAAVKPMVGSGSTTNPLISG